MIKWTKSIDDIIAERNSKSSVEIDAGDIYCILSDFIEQNCNQKDFEKFFEKETPIEENEE